MYHSESKCLKINYNSITYNSSYPITPIPVGNNLSWSFTTGGVGDSFEVLKNGSPIVGPRSAGGSLCPLRSGQFLASFGSPRIALGLTSAHQAVAPAVEFVGLGSNRTARPGPAQTSAAQGRRNHWQAFGTPVTSPAGFRGPACDGRSRGSQSIGTGQAHAVATAEEKA